MVNSGRGSTCERRERVPLEARKEFDSINLNAHNVSGRKHFHIK